MLMAGEFFSNPLYDHLTRRSRWPSLRLTLWLAFGLGLVTLTISALSLSSIPQAGALRTTALILMLVGALVTLVAPPVVAVFAAVLTARDARTGGHELMRLTPLSKAAIVRGYAFAVLFRLRVLLALVVALMPALVVEALYMTALGRAIFFNIACNLMHPELCHIMPWSLPPEAGRIFSLVLGTWGLILLAAALGVWLALRWRRTTAAAIVAPGLVALLIAASLIASINVLSGLVMALVLLLPWALALAIMRLAQESAPPHSR
jgi:hypothetical protein